MPTERQRSLPTGCFRLKQVQSHGLNSCAAATQNGPLGAVCTEVVFRLVGGYRCPAFAAICMPPEPTVARIPNHNVGVTDGDWAATNSMTDLF